MRWKSIAVGVVIASSALASCGQSPSTATATSSLTAPSSSSAQPTQPTQTNEATTDAIPSATVAQFASIVAKSRPDLDEMLETLSGPDCDWFSPGAVDVKSQSIVCSAGLTTVGLQAQTLSVSLVGASKEGVPAYVGSVPAELTSIVADTTAAADVLGAASDKARDCVYDAKPGCEAKLLEFRRGISSLRSQLAAWSPYGA